jgi:hypothetical protein
MRACGLEVEPYRLTRRPGSSQTCTGTRHTRTAIVSMKHGQPLCRPLGQRGLKKRVARSSAIRLRSPFASCSSPG